MELKRYLVSAFILVDERSTRTSSALYESNPNANIIRWQSRGSYALCLHRRRRYRNDQSGWSDGM